MKKHIFILNNYKAKKFQSSTLIRRSGINIIIRKRLYMAFSTNVSGYTDYQSGGFIFKLKSYGNPIYN
jgi:hypothetical protein